MKIEIKNRQLWLGPFLCNPPTLEADKDGNKVIIRRLCFGPLEVYEWGLNEKGEPYEKYEWCENDLYEDDNYSKVITREEFIKEIDHMKKVIKDTEFVSWLEIYEEAVRQISA
ncbi:MAG: hypothetical protein ACI4EF_11645 [Coprococcus sp.]